MTLQRTNPIPPGRYWLDLIGDSERVRWEGAVQGLNAAHPGILHVEGTTHHNAGEDGNAVPRDWVLFKVTAPMVWDFTIGTPTVAAASVTSEADTVQRPAPEPDLSTRIETALKSSQQAVQTIAWVVGGAILLGGLVIAVSHLGAKK